MDYRLELVIIPVTDIDRAKSFYVDNAGFNLDVDHSAGEDFRIVQLTPPGSACSITLMRKPEAAGLAGGPAPGRDRHRGGARGLVRPRRRRH